MKLSEQYARKINLLNEFTHNPQQVDKKAAEKKKETELPWYLPDNTYVRYGLYAAALSLFGRWIAAPTYRNLLAPGKVLSFKDWHSRFKLIKGNRKNGIPPHKSESLWRHCMNIATQKELHTAKDVYKKVADGKMKVNAAMAELDRIYSNQITPVQRVNMKNQLKAIRPARRPIPPPPSFDNINPTYITRAQFAILGPNQIAALIQNPALRFSQLP